MYLRELVESATTVWGRSGGQAVRKYRCTTGSRKGRVVAKPSTCTAPVNITKSKRFKQTKRKKAAPIAIKSKRTKSFNPGSKRIQRLNKPKRKTSPRKRVRSPKRKRT